MRYDGQLASITAPSRIGIPVFEAMLDGNGQNTIGGAAGNETVTAGNGNNTISAGGYSNVFTVGRGHNVITAGLGGASVHLGDGTDNVTLAGYSNTVSDGGGHAVISGGLANTYQVTGLGRAGGMEIMDFTSTSHDLLNLAPYLASLGATAGNFGGYVHVSETAGTTDSVVSIDPFGGGGAGFVVATLHGAGATSLADLQARGQILLPTNTDPLVSLRA